jgi:uncharacterized protein YjdB
MTRWADTVIAPERDSSRERRVRGGMRTTRLIWFVALVAAACDDASAPREPVSVSPPTLQLLTGDTARLAVSDASAAVRWQSSAPAVATVDRGGLVTGITPGSASIWALRGVDSASANVLVIGVKCAGAPELSPDNVTLAAGDTVRAYAQSGCSTIADVVWESSDPAVAVAVSRGVSGPTAVGMISAQRTGFAVVTARTAADPAVSVSMAVVVR